MRMGQIDEELRRRREASVAESKEQAWRSRYGIDTAAGLVLLKPLVGGHVDLVVDLLGHPNFRPSEHHGYVLCKPNGQKVYIMEGIHRRDRVSRRVRSEGVPAQVTGFHSHHDQTCPRR